MGKSSVVAQLAASKKLRLIDIRASLLDPTDLRGIPYVADGIARWSRPAFLPQDGDGPGILFFDELNAAPPLVQASLYQLTLDRRVGEYTLPDGWAILAAGNRAEDASIVFRMPAALANRFVHVDFEPDVEDWVTWALSAKLHPVVIGFIRTRRELLFKPPSTDRAFPTPRAWEMVSDAVNAFGTAVSASDVLVGIVGDGAATEFLAYCEKALTEQAIQVIIANPEHAALPSKVGELYALISYLASTAKDQSVLKAAGIVLNRLNPELAVLLARDVLRVNPRFASNPGYVDFVRSHKDFLK